MSGIEDVFAEFDEDEKEEEQKPEKEESKVPAETPEPQREEKSDLTDQHLEGEAPAPAVDEDISWFGEPEEEEVLATEDEAPKSDEELPEESAEKLTEELTEGEEEDEWFEEAEPKEEKTSTEETVEDAEEEWFEESEEQEEEPTDIVTVERPIGTIVPSSIVSLAISPEDMRAQMKLFQRMKASLLDKNNDISTIQGLPYIKRSGWRKFALAFNISDEIVKEERDEHGNDFTWRIRVKASAPNGRSVIGIGACSSEERNFAHVRHDVYATAHTRAKNRALSDLIGSGEVSWEELRGFDTI